MNFLKKKRISEEFFCFYTLLYFVMFFFLASRINPIGYDVYGGKIENGKYYFQMEKSRSAWKEVTQTDYKRSEAFDRVLVALLAFWAITFCIASYPSFCEISGEKHTLNKGK